MSEKTRMVVLDDLEQGKPLRFDGDTVHLPEELLDVHQSCIRFFGSLPALGIRDRDILLRNHEKENRHFPPHHRR